MTTSDDIKLHKRVVHSWYDSPPDTQMYNYGEREEVHVQRFDPNNRNDQLTSPKARSRNEVDSSTDKTAPQGLLDFKAWRLSTIS